MRKRNLGAGGARRGRLKFGRDKVRGGIGVGNATAGYGRGGREGGGGIMQDLQFSYLVGEARELPWDRVSLSRSAQPGPRNSKPETAQLPFETRCVDVVFASRDGPSFLLRGFSVAVLSGSFR